MGEKWHRVMQNLFGDQSEEEEVDSEHKSNPHPNSYRAITRLSIATARSTISGDLYRVDQRGVYNLTKAFQDCKKKMAQLRVGKSSKSKLTIVKFKTPESVDGWEVRQGTYFQDVVASKYDGGMDAKFEFTFTAEAVFSGYVFTRRGY
ncbi:protein HIGH CHLOROPHYLL FLUORESCENCE PHENOTYPE 173, chloroplastic-like [Malus sylvestris]|uniref:protein HIGH CHLOROPHYLL FLUORESCENCE PHENOTYPE 173, chloroplastic-like n=1 Tax=Malus sylvestris TaxID=3752 RepID=UPI0021ABA8BA|nr:protein HIGH CHLOROPHYLL FLUORESCENCE PHENOTYPE 173, chloroplastic-like [Malus sylvestris]XP_050153965.1 protein HIGH CHLOROPHYLL FLUORESCENCE PHENOTYPE 173, chloroplastic-like [Malus sylvestris]XP_050153966.1 protein HIGH CHLOROPHYLL FLUORESCENCE PHENOTYPE 173, chloroplastic-like [Malus sylvestris]XP_050153967.1 protein HIGH CHLOROPHYLL FLUORESCENCE PHENOTYPE 173, chloroplastic-like [Malus sylvestris]XP_050153968.1 protein HIGH CHLOROPHYLL FLUORESCENCE PHENOTYPE 173, chloroplastic-like [Mal